MLPIDFKEANFTYTKPRGWTNEQCSDLRVFKGADTEGTPVIISAWKPSREDLEALNKGEPLYLNICAIGMPPVSIFTENPFVVHEAQEG